MKNEKKKIHLLTLGCPKNLVDSEILMSRLKDKFQIVEKPEKAQILIINTCGFINSAKQESIDKIFEAIELKEKGKLDKIYVMGCLSERYKDELENEIPEVDKFFGVEKFSEVLKELGIDYKYELLGERDVLTTGHYAYLKISEGCDNPCSFCAIPLIRGKHTSRPMEEIIKEARKLAWKGVKELIIIAQDTTYYGLDIYGERKLAELLSRLSEIDGIEWIRLMYTFPAKFPEEVLDVIAHNPKICKYIDIPIQHISDKVLKSMRRGITKRKTIELLEKIREKISDVSIRTSLIVGYPEETQKEFEELLDFVYRFKFDRLGVFTYSQEEGTFAYKLGDPIPDEEKERRMALIMNAQHDIIIEKNENMLGKKVRVLIDRKEKNYYVGRTQWDAPEIDLEVLIQNENLKVGEFYEVEIYDFFEYDLIGRIIPDVESSSV
ncbi:SSU ribosomal protein S12P methylthiotransferase [Candidatus Kryptobacter tengchongensis]|uniref:30S ribosomal protein S12 methylthiotransferase RimO n=1 Tax=Kryptobacter tengchongensis TaxID=1643429 RepID=UPI00070766D7|nr:30S ribosomal protein S12 methylthiotransferase RimO [Candidatus Kryptobacter tengchongensis]CUS78471.1 SSU ribosomal protein S12P methylthiotransferase [Candidatus Kryptobacter tengchongensis]CUU07413.1 SSU ribosomal protein S12P methylthiotransferase [Candidatus Kryptobacter tengchongensis]